jgi:trehalose/maltose hydrolase-like predicted phosphorylase
MTSWRSDTSAAVLAFEGQDPADERRRESLLGLGNGVLFLRAAAPWAKADGQHYPGTYRAGCYDRQISVLAGEQVEDESLVNLPNCLPLTFRIAGDPAWFPAEADAVLQHRHALDVARGLAVRELLVRDAQGRHTRLRERRLVSLERPELVALRLEIEPLDWSGPVELRSALDGAVTNANVGRYDPFANRHITVTGCTAPHPGVLLLRAHTRQSRIGIAIAARTTTPGTRTIELGDAWIAEHLACEAIAGQALVVEKMAAIVTAHDPAISEAGQAALAAVLAAPDFEALEAAQARDWGLLWRRAHIEVGRPELERAARLHTFHLLQTVSPHTADRDAGLPARGWQEAYRGQIFWDELFAFPFLDLRFPEVTRGLLRYRHRRLRAAREAACMAGYRGAMYPWRSASDGREVTPRLQLNPYSGHFMQDPTRLQRHGGAAIAHNAWHHWLATGDLDFLAGAGGEMLVEIARFWASIAEPDAVEPGRFRIRGVIGPDEYHTAYPGAAAPGLDDNAYTNIMASWTLTRAVEALEALPMARRHSLRDALGLDADEPPLWDRVSRGLRVPFHDDGIISQFEGFGALKPADGEEMRRRHGDRRLDWALAAEGDSADAWQFTKQADVLMLFHLLPGEELLKMLGRMGYAVTEDGLRRTADYYLARITHESSLSLVACAGALARLDPIASWRLFGEALRTDFDTPYAASTAEGLHLGAMAGTLGLLQRCYLGLAPGDGVLHLDPAPPPELGPVRMPFRWHGMQFVLAWTGEELHLRSDPENPRRIRVHCRDGRELLRPGGLITLTPG